MGVVARLVGSGPVQFFRVLWQADHGLALLWWSVLLASGVLPAAFAVMTGRLITAVEDDAALAWPLGLVSGVFVLLQVLPQWHTAISMNLGSRVSALLNDRLAAACVEPAGIGHLEDPELTSDLTTARDFDRGISGPPMYLNVDFIAGSLTLMVSGVIAVVVMAGYSWWAPLALALAWGEHPLAAARERGLEGPQHRRGQPRAALGELLLRPRGRAGRRPRRSGCSAWPAGRSTGSPSGDGTCSTCSTPPPGCGSAASPARWRSCRRQRPGVLVAGRPGVLGRDVAGQVVTVASLAMGAQSIAFGGLNWAMDDAASTVRR